MTPLYRDEALRHRQAAAIGTLSAAASARHWTAALAAALFLAGLVMLAGYATLARKVSVSGQVVPAAGLVAVIAPMDGWVTRVEVTEGARVEQGDLLMVLESRRNQISSTGLLDVLDRIDARIAAGAQTHRAEVAVLMTQRHASETRRAGLQQTLDETLRQAQLAQRQVEVAASLLARFDRLKSARHVSELQFRAQEEKLLAARQELSRLRREIAAGQAELAAIDIELGAIPARIEGLQARARESAAVLEEHRAATDELLAREVRATAAGVVSLAGMAPGAAVSAGDSLARIVPPGARLQATLAVPSRAVGHVAEGDTLWLRYEAFPYQKFGHRRGTVQTVAVAPSPDATYRVEVQLQDQVIAGPRGDEPLKPGMALEADVTLERRTLLEWLFAPVAGMVDARKRQG